MENQGVQVEVTQPGADFDLTQIINGKEIVAPSPLSIYQIVSGNLFRGRTAWTSSETS
jgi:hypothetical protein